MVLKGGKKRTSQVNHGSSKKRKLSSAREGAVKEKKVKGKERASDRATVPIPFKDDADIELSDQDLEFFEEHHGAAGFLRTLDENSIARSKKETDRLHQLNKPVRASVVDDLPSVDSHDEDESSWDSEVDMEDDDLSVISSSASDADDGASTSSEPARHSRTKKPADSDQEMDYETLPRKRRPSWEPESDEDVGIRRLPIKLANGQIQKTDAKVYLPKEPQNDKSDTEESSSEHEEASQRPLVEDVATGARFGRPAVIDVIGNKSRKARLQAAKEQIASICQDIVSDPENSLGLLRRLHTFSLPEISTPTHPDPVPNDLVIRKLTLLSQLAVFKDIIPGYRIRALTDKEKSEKVSQLVQRTRDWEQGLVGVYQSYLRSLEAEVKAKSELAENALQCMCTLLTEATHFNFRVNLMSTVIAYLSRKSWNTSSDLCLSAIIKVFRGDNTGEASLDVVRLLNRMVKERKFNIHPEVLSCLPHLRLKNELGIRASESKADKPGEHEGKNLSKGRAAARRAKGKTTDQPHLSKKSKKALKERQEIAKEMREAAAEVDKEQRAANQTETLKLLFALYFRILKNPDPTPLLPAALQGISRFAHLVNIDFFRDLMQVLKGLMSRETPGAPQGPDSAPADMMAIQYHLLCIVTAFELLTGQGEALDIDLSDFINRLYAMIPPLSLVPNIESSPPQSTSSSSNSDNPRTSNDPLTSDLLFRALNLAFSPRTSASSGSPPWRSAAFCKRLLTASLHWPPATTIRALEFVGSLVERDSKIEALLCTDDQSVNGVYRPDLDDPQLCNPFGTSFWEVHLLLRTHWNADVRSAARKLLTLSSGSS